MFSLLFHLIVVLAIQWFFVWVHRSCSGCCCGECVDFLFLFFILWFVSLLLHTSHYLLPCVSWSLFFPLDSSHSFHFWAFTREDHHLSSPSSIPMSDFLFALGEKSESQLMDDHKHVLMCVLILYRLIQEDLSVRRKFKLEEGRRAWISSWDF